MARLTKSPLGRVVHGSVRIAFQRAYHHVQLDPQKYLRHVRHVYQLPVESWSEMRLLDEKAIAVPAGRIISTSARAAALEGAGLGLGGVVSILPDMGILAAIVVRMLQKLSLIHGFEYSTEEEVAALWLAAASAAGLDWTREFLERRAAEYVVPRIVDRVAMKFGAEVAEKWAGRIFPVVSAGIAGTLNYYLVRAWGRRAQKHFLERRQELRSDAPAHRLSLYPAGA